MSVIAIFQQLSVGVYTNLNDLQMESANAGADHRASLKLIFLAITPTATAVVPAV
jgi:hypothetical protein